MQNITTYAQLKREIELLEVEQGYKRLLLKEQFNLSFESLKPSNLIKSALKDFYYSPNLIDNVLSSTLGLASGYLSKKVVVGTSGNLLRKIIGSALQIGVTGLIVKHPEVINAFGKLILKHIVHKKGTNSKNSVR